MSFGKYTVKKPYGDIEPHEVFLDTLAKTREDEIGITGKRFEIPLKSQISYGILALFCLLAIVLLGKVAYLQVYQGKQLAITARNNEGSAKLVMPERGIIYDRNLQPLVHNSPAYDLVCDSNYFSASSAQIDHEVGDVSQAAGITKEAFLSSITASDSAEVLVANDIDHDHLLSLETVLPNVSSCHLTQNTIRNYVDGSEFSQVLGYTGRINQNEYANTAGYSINDSIGKTGLEKQYESYLRGIPGQANPKRTTAEKKSSSDVLVPPVPGDNLVLNIDAGLQKVIYDSLGQKLKEIGAQRGAAVAVDPRNGAVLALVSYPSYDDNAFSGGISSAAYGNLVNDPNQPLFDRAIAAKYPTGSIIKPLEAAAALQENIISPTKQINDPGYILVHSQYDPSVTYRFGGVKPHGWVDMRKAIAVSSNIYFYTVGGGYEDQQGLGPARIKKYLTAFGWDNKTGIDLPGEFGGFIPDPVWKKTVKGQSWYDGDTYNLSIGQSDLETTPMQVAMAYAAIANGGTLYQPQLVSKIVQGSGSGATTVKQFSPEVVRSNFIDPKNLEIVREGMRDGVTQDYGLSKSLNDLPVSAAAKTGTAEIGYNDKFNLWSASFAPYENPQIVIVVTAEAVNALGAVTLPVSHDALEYWFGNKTPAK